GGPIPTEPINGQSGKSAAGEEGRRSARERPTTAVYRATLQPVDPDDAANLPPQTLAGRVFIDAAPLSLAQRTWRAAAAVLIRESGF
ncbi:MAG TPA: peptidase, partial [Azospirillaceae bacterium]|nr:peptidase [Azospirillaceae bacterium]